MIDTKILGVVVFIVYFLMVTRKRDEGNTNHVLKFVRENFKRINPDFAKIPLHEGDSSYTENKTSITLCLKDKQGKYYDNNTIMYVALHELSHMITKKYDTEEHGVEFRAKFNHLLQRAAVLGMYDPTKPIPHTYCGVN